MERLQFDDAQMDKLESLGILSLLAGQFYFRSHVERIAEKKRRAVHWVCDRLERLMAESE